MGYTQTPGRGPINKYGALKQKGLLNPKKNIRKSARYFHGGSTLIEKINPFDRQSADKRKYKKETLKNIASNQPGIYGAQEAHQAAVYKSLYFQDDK